MNWPNWSARTSPAEDIATTSGWVTQRLGGFPKPGDTLALGDYQLRVERTDGMRVARLILTRHAGPPKPDQ